MPDIDQIEQLCRKATVKVLSPDGSITLGSGFWVAPELIVSCYHVVEPFCTDIKPRVKVRLDDGDKDARIIKHFIRPIDLALLEVEGKEPSSCVLLSGDGIKSSDPDSTIRGFGHTLAYEVSDTFKGEFEGIVQREGGPEIKIKSAQIEAGFSGGPLLYQGTCKVVGVCRSSRNSGLDLGGYGPPISVLFEKIPELSSLNEQWHQANPAWSEALRDTAIPVLQREHPLPNRIYFYAWAYRSDGAVRKANLASLLGLARYPFFAVLWTSEAKTDAARYFNAVREAVDQYRVDDRLATGFHWENIDLKDGERAWNRLSDRLYTSETRLGLNLVIEKADDLDKAKHLMKQALGKPSGVSFFCQIIGPYDPELQRQLEYLAKYLHYRPEQCYLLSRWDAPPEYSDRPLSEPSEEGTEQWQPMEWDAYVRMQARKRDFLTPHWLRCKIDSSLSAKINSRLAEKVLPIALRLRIEGSCTDLGIVQRVVELSTEKPLDNSLNTITQVLLDGQKLDTWLKNQKERSDFWRDYLLNYGIVLSPGRPHRDFSPTDWQSWLTQPFDRFDQETLKTIAQAEGNMASALGLLQDTAQRMAENADIACSRFAALPKLVEI